MKIRIAKIIYGPYNVRYLKSHSKSKVLIPIELEQDIHNKIATNLSMLEHVADKTGKEIRFYPKNEKLTLMNFGPFTTCIENNSPAGIVAEKMHALMNRVLKLDTQGANIKILHKQK